jgi:hypothetical protein
MEDAWVKSDQRDQRERENEKPLPIPLEIGKLDQEVGAQQQRGRKEQSHLIDNARQTNPLGYALSLAQRHA